MRENWPQFGRGPKNGSPRWIHPPTQTDQRCSHGIWEILYDAFSVRYEATPEELTCWAGGPCTISSVLRGIQTSNQSCISVRVCMIWSNVNLLLSDFEQFQIWTIFKFEHIQIWTDFWSWTNSNFEQIFESEHILVLNRIWIWTDFEWNRFWMEQILNRTDFEWNRFWMEQI
jgi:hypothetical protein